MDYRSGNTARVEKPVHTLQVVRGAAFRALLAGRTADVPGISEVTGLPEVTVRGAVGALVDAGMMILDGERVAGVAGLSTVATTHQLRLDGRWRYTWCAYDAVGIPAALGVDALVHTICPYCSRVIEFAVDAGRPPEDLPIVGWLPTTACRNLVREFCPAANLFCGPEHLAGWHRSNGERPGQIMTLAALAQRGVQNWGALL